MNLSGLLGLLHQQETYQALLAGLSGGESLGLIRSARPYVIAALALDTGRPTLVITARARMFMPPPVIRVIDSSPAPLTAASTFIRYRSISISRRYTHPYCPI